MELLHRRCCGLDVHKETVVACLRLVSDGKVTTEVRTFQTTTVDLLRLSEWLAANDCTHVAMEATGVYWKPVWHILDDGQFELVLANAAHVKGSTPPVDLAIPLFGYQNHVSIDRRFGFIRRWAATDAAAYEGCRLRQGWLDK